VNDDAGNRVRGSLASHGPEELNQDQQQQESHGFSPVPIDESQGGFAFALSCEGVRLFPEPCLWDNDAFFLRLTRTN
jgi:hypothetical protein